MNEAARDLTFDFLRFACGLHWLPLALGGVLLVSVLTRRSRTPGNSTDFLEEALSWLMFTIWAFQSNALIYEIFETPHAFLRVEILPAIFRDVLGSFCIGAILALLDCLLIWFSKRPAGKALERGVNRSQGRLRGALFLVILFQLAINAGGMAIVALELAVVSAIPPGF